MFLKLGILRKENGTAVRVGDQLDRSILFFLPIPGPGKRCERLGMRVCRARGSSREFSKHKSSLDLTAELPRNLAIALRSPGLARSLFFPRETCLLLLPRLPLVPGEDPQCALPACFHPFLTLSLPTAPHVLPPSSLFLREVLPWLACSVPSWQ